MTNKSVITVICVAALISLLVYLAIRVPLKAPKTIHQDNREKLIELLERSQKLEQKIDQLNEAMHSVTNQMFMIPVFPDARSIATNDILQAFGRPAIVPL